MVTLTCPVPNCQAPLPRKGAILRRTDINSHLRDIHKVPLSNRRGGNEAKKRETHREVYREWLRNQGHPLDVSFFDPDAAEEDEDPNEETADEEDATEDQPRESEEEDEKAQAGGANGEEGEGSPTVSSAADAPLAAVDAAPMTKPDDDEEVTGEEGPQGFVDGDPECPWHIRNKQYKKKLQKLIDSRAKHPNDFDMAVIARQICNEDDAHVAQFESFVARELAWRHCKISFQAGFVRAAAKHWIRWLRRNSSVHFLRHLQEQLEKLTKNGLGVDGEWEWSPRAGSM